MSYPSDDLIPGRTPAPIPVEIRNFPLPPKVVRATKTTTQMFAVNSPSGSANSYQIAAYEPTRVRMLIYAYDNPIGVVFGDQPKTTPDPTSAGSPPSQGIVIPTAAAMPWEFRGCDAAWINAVVGGATRVAVIKEYE